MSSWPSNQGLDSHIIFAGDNVVEIEGDIKTRSRLGSYLNYYYRDPPDALHFILRPLPVT